MQILLTHGHLDHVGAAAELAQHYGVPVIGPEKEDEFWLEGLPAQSRMFGPRIANRCVRIAGSMKAMWSMWGMWRCRCCTARAIRRAMWSFDDASRLLISGDVIFKGGVGRSDFPRGDHGQLIAAIKEKLLPLGDDVTFIPGHGPLSTLGEERRNNPFLQDEMPVW